jgi:hypothetical protein
MGIIVISLNNSSVDIDKCVAYCPTHNIYLTEVGLKTKKCLSKYNKITGNQECGVLHKLDHLFWIERQQNRIEKKNKEAAERKRLMKLYNKSNKGKYINTRPSIRKGKVNGIDMKDD